MIQYPFCQRAIGRKYKGPKARKVKALRMSETSKMTPKETLLLRISCFCLDLWCSARTNLEPFYSQKQESCSSLVARLRACFKILRDMCLEKEGWDAESTCDGLVAVRLLLLGVIFVPFLFFWCCFVCSYLLNFEVGIRLQEFYHGGWGPSGRNPSIGSFCWGVLLRLGTSPWVVWGCSTSSGPAESAMDEGHNASRVVVFTSWCLSLIFCSNKLTKTCQ